jgi:hypothetical protein
MLNKVVINLIILFLGFLPFQLYSAQSQLNIEVKIMTEIPTAFIHLFDKAGVKMITYRITSKSDTPQTIFIKNRLIGYSSSFTPFEEVLLDSKGKPIYMNVLISPDRYELLYMDNPNARIESIILNSSHTVVFSTMCAVTLLAYDYFPKSGFEDSGKLWHENKDILPLLCAWINPYYVGLEKILARAREIYPQADTANRVRSIYDAIKESNKIGYMDKSLILRKEVGQKIRQVPVTEYYQNFNCIEISALFASCLLAADIDPILILKPGHAFLGWRTEEKSNKFEIFDPVELEVKSFNEAIDLAHGKLPATVLDQLTTNIVIKDGYLEYEKEEIQIIDIKYWFIEKQFTPTPIIPVAINQQFDEKYGEIFELLNRWQVYWQLHDIKSFMSLYSEESPGKETFFVFGKQEGAKQLNLDNFRKWKEIVFKKYNYIHIERSTPQIIFENNDQTAKVCFFQNFISDKYSDSGYKILNLTKSSDTWKITGENFIWKLINEKNDK